VSVDWPNEAKLEGETLHTCAREVVTFAYMAIMDAGLAQASNNLPVGRARASVAQSIGRVSQWSRELGQ
jgi:hypothetical protein